MLLEVPDGSLGEAIFLAAGYAESGLIEAP
jgi:hypothetical protein